MSVSSVHRAAWPRYFPDSANTMETAGRDAAGGRDLFRGRVRKTRLEERDEGGRNNRQPGTQGGDNMDNIYILHSQTKRDENCPQEGRNMYAGLSAGMRAEEAHKNGFILCHTVT